MDRHLLGIFVLPCINKLVGVDSCDFKSTIQFGCGQMLKSRKSSWLFYGAILVNLGLLFSFKYQNLLGKLDVSMGLGLFDGGSWMVPLGLSFYTFQGISYLIESKRDTLVKASFGNYVSYMLFFPKIIAGPIDKPNDFLQQDLGSTITYERFQKGFQKILYGLFKKIFIAGNIHFLLNQIEALEHPTMLEWLLSNALYPIEIFAEFSGYTDIALGCGLLFGIKLTENFKNPLTASSLTQFWRRWHISLTSWLT